MLRVGWWGRNCENWVLANGKSKMTPKCGETVCWGSDTASDEGIHGFRWGERLGAALGRVHEDRCRCMRRGLMMP
jgi:hypothetical protein